MTTKPTRKRTFGLLLVVLVVSLAVLGWPHVEAGYYYWRFMRPKTGSRLRLTQAPLVVGPVLPGQGIPGVVTLGMPRATVIKINWPPIWSRMSFEEGRRWNPFVIDAKDVDEDFYQGFFGWVGYSPEDRVSTVRFSWSDYPRLRLVVRGPSGWFVIDRSLQVHNAARVLRMNGFEDAEAFGTYLTADGGAIALDFLPVEAGGRLENVVVSKGRGTP